MDSDDSDIDIERLFEGETSSDEEVYDEERRQSELLSRLQRIKENDPRAKTLRGSGYEDWVQNKNDEDWEQLGQDIANSTHLECVLLRYNALNDHKMSFFFRGLTRSSSVKEIALFSNGFGVEGVRSMVPFLQNSNSLRSLDLDNNNMQSAGFNVLFRALRDSPIKYLTCNSCRIQSIEIDIGYFPRRLRVLCLNMNCIDADGCRGLATLLEGRNNSALTNLYLDENKIDDECIAILVDALRNNSSLKTLDLRRNYGISNQGKIMLLKLVCDVSSIKATLQSNHTLRHIKLRDYDDDDDDDDEVQNEDELLDTDDYIQTQIDEATLINKSYESNPALGREKVVQSQLHSGQRAELCRLQEVDRSLYSEINPLHLPEVLSLIGQRHGQEELYVALLSSIMPLFSTMNRKKCIQQQREYYTAKIAEYTAKVEELDDELETMEEEAERSRDDIIDSQSNKRRRTSRDMVGSNAC